MAEEKAQESFSSTESVSLMKPGSEHAKLNPNSHILLQTKYHPQNTPEIHTLLSKPEASIASLDSDINHVQQVLFTLLTKRIVLQDTLSSHRLLPSPIRRLPSELLSEIFLSRVSLCAGSSGDGVLTTSFTNLHTDTLWTILQVCSLWRTIAQSTPRLWNTLLINITPLKGKARAYNNLLTRLSTCIGNFLPTALPLNFAIIGTHYQDSSHLSSLIVALCAHAERWGKVYFCPYTTNILTNWWYLDSKARRPISTPQLSALGLTSFDPTPGVIQTPVQITHAPRLKKLALYDYRPLPNTSDMLLSPPLFLNQLTHLYLDSCPYRTYPEILSYLPHLIHLEIFNKYQESTRLLGTSSTTPPRIHLPELRTIKATGWLSNLCSFLPHLGVPMIERIRILALAEQCHPCTCGAVKMRIVNDWVGMLGKDVAITIDHVTNWEIKTSTDLGIVDFLFGED